MKARFQQFNAGLPFWVAILILAFCLLPAGRIPTGDAPHLLGISGRLAEELTHLEWGAFSHHLGSLIAPHPPGAYLVPTAAYAVGLGVWAPFFSATVALYFIWKGLCLLAFRERPIQSWPALLILLACPLFWLAFSELYWDLFAAACLCMCLGHGVASDGLRNRRHSLHFGLWMGAGFLCKYTFPAFAFFPTILMAIGAWKAKTHKNLLVAFGAFLVLAGPWLLFQWGQVLPYVFDSLNTDSQLVDHASISGATDPLYYLIVLKDALGWPGLGLLLLGLGAWRQPGARMALTGGLSGIFVLSWMGQQEPRYLLPALPLLATASACSLGALKGPYRWPGHLVFLAITLPMLSFSSGANRLDAQVPAERMHEHHRASLERWGNWPQVNASFMPVSSHPDAFGIDTALKSLAKHKNEEDGDTIGLLLDGTAGELKDGLFFFRSARLGLFWDFVSLAPPPGGRGKVFGKFKGPFHAKNEAPARFRLLYAATSAQDKTRQRWLTENSATELERFQLPNGLQGQVLRLNNWVQTDREIQR